MSAMVAVFTREMRERSRLFLIAAGLAVIPFLAALVPAARGQRGTLIAIVGGGLALIYAEAVALLLGVSVIGRDLAQKKLSFYFAKPIGAAALWSGKAVASLMTIFVAMFIIGVPSFLASRDGWWNAYHTTGIPAVPLIVGLCVGVFVVSHALTTMLRSRSALISVDFACAIAITGAAYFLFRMLLAGSATKAASVVVGLSPAVIVILLIAPVWQLARGRTDVKRGHAAFSAFVWTSLAAIVLLIGAYTAWVVNAPLSTLTEVGLSQQTSNGEWVLVSGASSRGGEIAGFVNTRTGETVRARLGMHWGVAASRDGSTLVMETAVFDNKHPDFAFDVYSFGKSAKPLRIPVDQPILDYDLWRDGSRLAVVTAHDVRVLDARTGNLLAAARIEGRNDERVYFVTPSLVRIVSGGVIREFDVERKSIVQTGEMASTPWMTVSDDGSRAYLPQSSRILDARTGATIATLPQAGAVYRAAMMNDGRVLVLEGGETTVALRVFDRDGHELRRIALPNLDRSAVRAQLGENKVVVGGAKGCVIVDLERGTAGKVANGVRGPITWGRSVHFLQLTKDARIVGSEAATKKLVVWDPGSGAVSPLSL